MELLNTLEDINSFINNNKLSMLYVSSNNCSVCHVLLPKIQDLLKNYPKINFKEIIIENIPEAAGELSVFTIPVIIFYIEGKEFFRRGRFISIDELEALIERYYKLLE